VNAVRAACHHCGESIPAGVELHANLDGRLQPMCCAGCVAAAEWIAQLGLGDYYRLRSSPAPRAPTRDEADRNRAAWQRAELVRHVVRDIGGGQREALLLVEGVRCAACVWLIERALGVLAGVSAVHVNAGARRARVVWDDAQCSLSDIIGALARAGYSALPLDAGALDDVRKRESREALKRLLVAGFGMMQAMMYASAIYLGAIADMDAATRDWFRWFGLLVATPVVFYSARPFFAGAARSLAARRLGMDVPVALAIGLIYAASVIEAIVGGAEVYFDSVSMFVFFLLVGRYLEMRARHRAGDLTDALARLTPAVADRWRDDGTLERVGAIELRAGDLVHIAEGTGVPADGVLAGSCCRVDESMLSGESSPVLKRQGDPLVAGSIVVEGPARLEIGRTGNETVLAGIIALVTRAATERPRLAAAGERAAAGFVARVLALAAITAIGWSLVDPQRAFGATLAVLVVSCPCAFALAVPAALTRALAVLARRGVLVVHPDAIEQLAHASHAIFDKTGTLTADDLAVERIEIVRTEEAGEATASTVALARGSRHPVARAIVARCGDDGRLRADSVRSIAGQGIEGRVAGRRMRLGREDFATNGEAVGDGATVLADERGVIARFHLSEPLRGDAFETIDALRASGMRVAILSGDAPHKVAGIAARLGVRDWHADQRPDDKLARLRELRARGAKLLVVGDGINDAPVLAAADVAVALASGSELARVSSGIVLTGERLGALAWARSVAQEALVVLARNQRWTLGYNLAAIPLAALGFVPPWLAAIGMSASSLMVVLNALRIGRRRDDSADFAGATIAEASA
jgi:Cu2+-exporting ATPase